MRVPLSWLREYVDLPATETGRDVQAKLISAGLEVETVEQLGADLKGPLVVGQVLTIEELEGFKKPIRFCTVDVGSANGTGEPQEIVCGARNFAVGDKVVVVLPGAILPGGFSIAARKTYGKMSHGMICSGDELGMGDDGSHGIIVLPPETEVGRDAIELLELVDEVLDIAVTANRGYCLSIRGVAREAAIAYGLPLRDPALHRRARPRTPTATRSRSPTRPAATASPPARSPASSAEARSPIWLQRRLQKVGMRPISLAVDVTNYVMMELGQPLHAYDRGLRPGRHRRAPGRGRARRSSPSTASSAKLHAEDLVITDDRGPIGLAGVMGGANTEIADHDADGDGGDATTDVVIEAAHFDAGLHRPHRPPAQAVLRGVPALRARRRPAGRRRRRAAHRRPAGAARGRHRRGRRHRDHRPVRAAHHHHPGRPPRPGRGRRLRPRDRRTPPPAGRLRRVRAGRADRHRAVLAARPDRPERPRRRGHPAGGLREPALHPAQAPRGPRPDRPAAAAPPGRPGAGRRGLRRGAELPVHRRARLRPARLAADDPARRVVKLVNPLSDEEPALRTTLLPGLLGALRRNDGRGSHDLALFETGLVFRPPARSGAVAGTCPSTARPTDEEIAALDAALPDQPRHVAVVLAGAREQAGWWGKGRPADWADAVEAARTVAREAGAELIVRDGPVRAVAPRPLRRAGRRRRRRGARRRPRGRAAPARRSRRSACPRAPARWSWTWTRWSGPANGTPQAPRHLHLPGRHAGRRAGRRRARCPPRRSRRRCARARANCWSPSGCSTSTRTREQLGEGQKSLAYALRFRAGDRTLTVGGGVGRAGRGRGPGGRAHRSGAARLARPTEREGAGGGHGYASRSPVPRPWRRRRRPEAAPGTARPATARPRAPT